MRITASFVAIIALLLTLPARADLINGSLEASGAPFTYQLVPGGSALIPGWTTIDSGVEWFQPTAFADNPPPAGSYVVDLANYFNSAGGLQQTFATLPGATYVVNFQLGTSQSVGRNGSCEIVVAADGVSEIYSALNLSALTVYTPRVFTFVADDASATLSLRCLQDATQHFAFVDAVTLNAAAAVPERSRLALRSYPNPFNPQTELAFTLTEAGDIELAVFDLRGARVRVLHRGTLEAGEHAVGWDGRNDQGQPLASGVYLTRLVSGQETDHVRMTMLE